MQIHPVFILVIESFAKYQLEHNFLNLRFVRISTFLTVLSFFFSASQKVRDHLLNASLSFFENTKYICSSKGLKEQNVDLFFVCICYCEIFFFHLKARGLELKEPSPHKCRNVPSKPAVP